MILKRNEATTRRGLGSWKVRAIASFECATEMPVESTSKRRCARRSTPTVSSPSPEGRGGQGVRTSRRLRRLTAARPGLGLVLGLERPSHVAGTLPRSHQLGIIAEPIADHLVQQAGPHPLTPSPSGRGGTKREFPFAPLGRVLV